MQRPSGGRPRLYGNGEFLGGGTVQRGGLGKECNPGGRRAGQPFGNDRGASVAEQYRRTESAGGGGLLSEQPPVRALSDAAEFGQRFAPDTTGVNAVKAMLEHAGMTDIQVGPHGVYVSAVATVAQLRSTFHVSQNMYSYKGMTLRANKEEPTLPAALAGKILYVEGLDDTTLLRQPFHHSVTVGNLVAPAAAAAAAAVTPPPVAAGNGSPYCNKYFGAGALVAKLSTAADVYGAAIPWLGCGYTPQQIQAAYGLNKVTKYNGKGVTVAIVDAYASPTLMADANRYAANHDLPKLKSGVNFSQIIPVGIYDVSPTEACGPYGWWEEQSLDMAAVHGAAPGADIVFVGSRDCDTSLDIAFFNTLYNHVADVVTDSWGNNGESIAPGSQAMYDQAAMAGAAQGMTVLFSSGDDGDLSAPNGVASGSWPATSAWVTGVGGTSLKIMDASGAKSEVRLGHLSRLPGGRYGEECDLRDDLRRRDDHGLRRDLRRLFVLFRLGWRHQSARSAALLSGGRGARGAGDLAQSGERLHRDASFAAARKPRRGHGG